MKGQSGDASFGDEKIETYMSVSASRKARRAASCRERFLSRKLSRNAASFDVGALGVAHFPTLTDRRSGRDAGRDARARGHERESSETRAVFANGSRVASVRGTRGESSASARARGAVRFQKQHREASSGFARTRPRRGRRGESKRDRKRRAAGFVPCRLRSDRCARLGRASSARA